MERGRSILTDQQSGAGAPAAGMPGRGVGNIPYARGMASGNFGSRVASIQPRQEPNVPAPAAAPPQGPPASGGPPPSAAAPPGPLPQPTNPMLSPMFYFDVMGSYMQALLKAANSEGGFY